MVKTAVPVKANLIYSALQNFRERVQEQESVEVDSADGVRVGWPDGWVHVRVSNTESIIRVIAESQDPKRARELADWAQERLL
jgi:phosphomannomutase